MRCRVCHHAERGAIEAACATRAIAAVAEKFGLSESALERHVTNHPCVFEPAEVDDAPETQRSPGQVAA